MGRKYEVVFSVDYSATPGAIGPATVHLQGEILPTPWQSMMREKDIGERIGIGFVGGIGGLLLLGAIGAGLAGRVGIAWLLFLVTPIIFVLAIRPIAATRIAHMQRSGDTSTSMEKVPSWVLWWLPLGLGLLFALICLLLPDTGTAFLIGALVGGIVGIALGFIVDGAKVAKIDSSSQ